MQLTVELSFLDDPLDPCVSIYGLSRPCCYEFVNNLANTECSSEVRSCHPSQRSHRGIYQVVRRRQETDTDLQHLYLSISDNLESNRFLYQHLTVINTASGTIASDTATTNALTTSGVGITSKSDIVLFRGLNNSIYMDAHPGRRLCYSDV